MLMGDSQSFRKIMASDSPAHVKKLGRLVHPWDQDKWDRTVLTIAREAVRQKFLKVPGLAEVLLSTGDAIVAECTRNDHNWGTGVDMTDVRANSPSKWPGRNILGWALMQARSDLRNPQQIAKVATSLANKIRREAAALDASASAPGCDFGQYILRDLPVPCVYLDQQFMTKVVPVADTVSVSRKYLCLPSIDTHIYDTVLWRASLCCCGLVPLCSQIHPLSTLQARHE